MILYKYVSFEAAIEIIETSSIGFTNLEDLNDPFEAAALRFPKGVGGNLSESIVIGATKNRLSRNFGVLSLTRQPLNPLMWSHYGDSHKGVVVGIDVNKARLADEKSCVIPAQFGEIIYTQTKPHSSLSAPSHQRLMEIGDEIKSFNTHDYNLFKQAFLYKSLEWAYEEEVRVVKNISAEPYVSRSKEDTFKNNSGNWKQVVIEGRPLFCLGIPKHSIVECYLGKSIYKNVTRNGYPESEFDKITGAWRKSHIKVYNCKPDVDTWNLIRYVHTPVI